jgi:hypothetical protein
VNLIISLEFLVNFSCDEVELFHFFLQAALFNERYNNDSTIFTMLDCDESWWQQKAWLIRCCHRIQITVRWRWCCGVSPVAVTSVTSFM